MEIINLLSLPIIAQTAVDCSSGIDGECLVPASLGVLAGLREVIRVLINDTGAGSIFSIVLQPCKLFAGLGIIFFLAPLLNTNIDSLKTEFSKIVTMLLLAILLMGDGNVAQALGVANYATIKGMNTIISNGIRDAADMKKVVGNISNNSAIGREVNGKLSSCLNISPTLTGATVYTQVQLDWV